MLLELELGEGEGLLLLCLLSLLLLLLLRGGGRLGRRHGQHLNLVHVETVHVEVGQVEVVHDGILAESWGKCGIFRLIWQALSDAEFSTKRRYD